MGYYVQIIESNVYIPSEHLDDAYKAMCELNNHNELKRGGSFPVREPVVGDGPHPDVWFSWMPWNYHETCKSAREVLDAVGFDVISLTDGLEIVGYDNKTGCEQEFMWAIAPFVRSLDDNPPVIRWRGEDASCWQMEFVDGKMFMRNVILTESPEAYQFNPTK